jgi:hypothetical protein
LGDEIGILIYCHLADVPFAAQLPPHRIAGKAQVAIQRGSEVGGITHANLIENGLEIVVWVLLQGQGTRDVNASAAAHPLQGADGDAFPFELYVTLQIAEAERKAAVGEADVPDVKGPVDQRPRGRSREAKMQLRAARGLELGIKEREQSSIGLTFGAYRKA